MKALSEDQRFQFRDLMPAILLLALLLGSIAVAVLRPTGKDDQYIVMVAPWRTLNSVVSSIQAAEGAIVSINASNSLITVYSENKEFPSRLYSAGVWLVFEPLLPGGCYGIQERTTAA
ncbi:hypothetical protein [Pseudochrobactrum asaccharolyticum]|jgi:hypothetical protein|uniref:Uncharacterized protein n=1 Tax=Pseudochrobactrum asaccharolyticum TaxID=354351 RepID=A0A366DPY8_9HYPH|nr:hypothetical protein [Pseudochrobactrum asaccharolyticum]MBX8802866.1 hypothetical protein [Ochrobactrum sp. MR28]MBX8818455.1 hypothetical protein [Ochrobactrum sp. MR31]MDR2310114.1 hypothetical protein [Brucellaceae bacterium]RBO91268.1 hypothetical protein DFR47_109128 [Pseudochrobactrum asaccharolyticum]